MSDFILTADERALIEERRKQQAQAELAAREDAKIPDVASLSTAQIMALTDEQQARAMKNLLAIALRGENQ